MDCNLSPIRGLSVMQPWAGLIVHGPKRTENRIWNTRYRGWLLICASKRRDPWLPGDAELNHWRVKREDLDPLGVALGVACLKDIDTTVVSEWDAHGQYHWRLIDVRPFKNPFPLKGRQRLFHLSDQEKEAVNRALRGE